MRRRFRTKGLSIWRDKRNAEQALRPLLMSLDSAAPPEGLLRAIERRIDGLSSEHARRRKDVFWCFKVPIAASLVAWVFGAHRFLPQPPQIVLIDPSGMPVAQLQAYGSEAIVRLTAPSKDRRAKKMWHLWGLRPLGARPVFLGLLGANGLRVFGFEDFVGFAMSLEDVGFTDDLPVGPVLVLSEAN